MEPCTCEDWKNSEPQLSGFTSLAWTHSMKYTGVQWRFCPWCGRNLTMRVLDDALADCPYRSIEKNPILGEIQICEWRRRQ